MTTAQADAFFGIFGVKREEARYPFEPDWMEDYVRKTEQAAKARVRVRIIIRWNHYRKTMRGRR